MPLLSPSLPRGRILLITAAPAETRAIAAALNIAPPERAWQLLHSSRGFDLLMSGISKSNAAGAAARFLNPTTHSAVLSIGVAGALQRQPPDPHATLTPTPTHSAANPPLPGGKGLGVGRSAQTPPDYNAPSPLPLGSIILASASIFADEGLQSPDSFEDTAAMGFPLADTSSASFSPDPALLEFLRPAADLIAPIATVSTCSGTDALAAEVARRSSAAAEAMEGAAIALIAHRLNIPFAELRTISNTTGNRPSQHWDLPAALAALTRVVEML